MQKYKILVLGINENEGSGLLRTRRSVAISLLFTSGRFLMKFNVTHRALMCGKVNNKNYEDTYRWTN